MTSTAHPQSTRQKQPQGALVALAMFCTLAISSAAGAEPHRLWVSTTGSDSAPGTEAAPLATVQHALDQATQGTVINIGPGVFRERLVIRKSGTEDERIVLVGTKDAQGKLLTRIDGGTLLPPEVWTPAPEVAEGVYKTTALKEEPEFVTVDGMSLPRLNAVAGKIEEDGGRQFRGIEVMAWPDGPVAEAPVPGVDVWATLGGAYLHVEGVTYVRLKNRDDIRPHAVSISPAGQVVLLDNARHISLYRIEIGGGEAGVVIRGTLAAHNRIEGCRIVNGRARVRITDKAHSNEVMNCYLSIGFLGIQPGPWWTDTATDVAPSEELQARRFLYRFYKTFSSAKTTSDDKSLVIDGASANNRIEHNHLDGGLIGLEVGETTGLIIRNNRIHNFSSVGMALRGGATQLNVSDNDIRDCNISIRLHEMNSPKGHLVHVWNNLCHQPAGVGTQLYGHFFTAKDLPRTPTPALPSTTFIYHNTFVGGFRGIYIPKPTAENPARFVVVNNIFTHQGLPLSVGSGDDPDRWTFSHNLVATDPHNSAKPPHWLASTNLTAKTATSAETEAAGKARGLDLTLPFKAGTLTEPFLRGAEHGRFEGEKPDLGVQHKAQP